MNRDAGRLGAAQHWFRVELPSDPAMLPWVSHGLRTFLRASGWSRRDTFRIDLAVNEAMHNAITHGNSRRADRTVELVVSDVEDGVWFDVVDRGNGFDVGRLQSVTERNREMLEGGRGVALMLRLMDNVEVVRGPGENRVRMWKTRPGAMEMRKAG
ncbi:MAG: ATP-binding protein [Candidatus Eisenbacteria bacterium]|nr:ATP-binding protein [Candidatus Eisenbacteria bacterium]